MSTDSRRSAERPQRRDRRRSSAPGQRAVDPLTLLAFGIPLLTVALLATVNPAPTEEAAQPPTATPLTNTVLVCPPALGGADLVQAALADTDVAGALRTGGKDLTLSAGSVATRRTSDTLLLRGEGPTASGLAAARTGGGLATDCLRPASDVWFAGVGAGPEHSSVLRLVNPDGGPAIADVVVHAAGGIREVPALRGVAVGARDELALDLAEVMPEREDVTLHLRVTRGRLASSIVDRVDPLGSDERATTWLPAVAEPATDAFLPGVRRGGGERTLVLTNPGDDETRVRLKAVTPESEFAPTDLSEVPVPAGATVTVDLGRFLRSQAAQGLVALRVEADAPVASLLRSRDGNRLTHAVAAALLAESGALAVAGGDQRLVLAGAEKPSNVRVVQRAADGTALKELRVTVRPGQGTRLELAARARWVQVLVGDVPVVAALEAGDTSVRPVRELVTDSWVPHVGPALY
ncbi:DUF5719 family protein [Nocardioides daphniae]|uniref:Uncharacterized protein n=1 Tax=Nocardioides daphniae TaxID=402297 RepID=A0A4P7UEK3_9ACTN|nr:DUF5719 family protein [Nocardioides daphniae]QCC77845.1 hypothetical protein E2C04_12840 [Nocardioides daphniae]GGD27764.1 hypothetical protein GCM10007231_29060 [Nocardioides daphniae]